MPRKNLQKEKDSYGSNKLSKGKTFKFGRIPTRSTKLDVENEQTSLNFKRKKGRQRIQTSLIVFELDDKSIEYILGDEKATVVPNLYQMIRDGIKPVFLSRQLEVVQRLQNEIPYFVETEVLKKQGAREELQEEIMNIIQQHVTEKIHPDSSVYIGTLFNQEEMRGQPFSFGTVCTPSDYFSQVQQSYEVESEKAEDQTSSRTSPVRTGDIEFEQKELDSSFYSKPESVKHRPFDDFDTSQTSSQKRFLFPLPELQERHTLLYYSKIKDLNTQISCKLSSRFEKIKVGAQQDIGKGTASPEDSKLSPLDEGLQSGKRKRDFEEDIFEEYVSEIATKSKLNDDIFDSSENIKDNKEITSKIQNIRFEVLDDFDAQPIIKKLKGPDIKTLLDFNNQARVEGSGFVEGFTLPDIS